LRESPVGRHDRPPELLDVQVHVQQHEGEALLFEAGRGDNFDHTVAVTVPRERQRAWALERGVDGETLRAIEARQLTQEEKARQADVVVENDAGLDRLKEQAGEFWARISGEKNSEGGIGQGA